MIDMTAAELGKALVLATIGGVGATIGKSLYLRFRRRRLPKATAPAPTRRTFHTEEGELRELQNRLRELQADGWHPHAPITFSHATNATHYFCSYCHANTIPDQFGECPQCHVRRPMKAVPVTTRHYTLTVYKDVPQ